MSLAMAQHVLQMTRLKLAKENSTAEPRLLRLLACANLADTICNQCIGPALSKREIDARHNAIQEQRSADRRHLLSCQKSTSSTRLSTTPSQSRIYESVPGSGPPSTEPRQAFSRPRVSVHDRVAFRRSIDQQSKQCDDSSVESDSDSDAAYSDDEWDSDDESYYSSEDDTEDQLRRDFIKPVGKASNNAAS